MSGAVEFEQITKDESWGVFDAAAHRLLGCSGEEFARAWDEGRYAHDDEVAVMKVAMLRPSGR
jgi:hypothetical protein